MSIASSLLAGVEDKKVGECRAANTEEFSKCVLDADQSKVVQEQIIKNAYELVRRESGKNGNEVVNYVKGFNTHSSKMFHAWIYGQYGDFETKELALGFYESVAAQDPEAAINASILVRILYEDEGGAIKRAFELAKISAAGGSSRGKYWYASYLINGEAGVKDVREGIDIMSSLIEEGYEPAIEYQKLFNSKFEKERKKGNKQE